LRPSTLPRVAATLVVALALLLVLGGGLQPAGSDVHEDTTFGFKLRPPDDWTKIPVKLNEGWLVAKYISDREYSYTEKGGWTYMHRPELMAIAFIDKSLLEDDEEVEVDEDDDEVVVRFRNRYEDYKDYLKKTYSGGGYYVAAEEESERNGIPVTELEIKVEKLTRTGPKRIVTWIYHLDGVDVAVHVEVLEDHYKKLKRKIEKSLGSFEEIPRTGELPTDQGSSGDLWFSFSKLDELSLAERNRRMMEQCESLHERVIESLPEGWEHSSEKSCLIVTNADLKYARRMAEQTEAVMGWLEKNFPYVGPQCYVRQPIIRFCKTQDESWAYRRGGGGMGWLGMNMEFVTSLEQQRDWIGEFDWISGQIATHWFQDRDRELWWATPEWLQYGMAELFDNSKLKGKKLSFHRDEWDRDDLREAVREDRVRGIESLLKMTRSELWDSSGGDFWSALEESEGLVYFLIAGKGSKNKKYREIIPTYLQNLKAVLEEEKAREKEEGKDSTAPPETEEEEEERFRKRREELREREQEFLRKVFDRTFEGWSERDWQKLDKAFLDSIS